MNTVPTAPLSKNVSSTKTTVRRKITKPAPVVVAAPVVAAPEVPVVAAPVVAAPVVEAPVLSFRERLELLAQSAQQFSETMKSQVRELRKLQREHEVLLKNASKKSKKKKLPRDFSKLRRSTGFAEPVLVSNELYTFLVKTNATMKDSNFTPSNQEEYDSWPRVPVQAGVPVARTDVTSHISKYIKDHSLQNPTERREINPDALLKKIFSEPVESSKSDASKKVYTYLKLQKYVNHHFPSRKAADTA